MQVPCPARDWFLEQMGTFSRDRVDWSNDVVIRLPRDSDREYAKFGFNLEHLSIQSWLDPAPPGVKGMGRPLGMLAGVLYFDLPRALILVSDAWSWGGLEWARLNPEKFRFFFVIMVRDVGFSTIL